MWCDKKTVNVVIGTPIYRQGAYVLDKFLYNQKQIQQSYPLSELILATSEYDFIKELESLVSFWKLKVLLCSIENSRFINT
ncbi:unnamed protein product [marine sediment metagenome]|uniref:Uncharacterized protein n=1 Tax=marine sediment metagenome TaxID=412755 RepID=X0S4G5_9ZZZZ